MTLFILAIDPGLSGGFAWGINEPGDMKCAPMPATQGDMTTFIRDRTDEANRLNIAPRIAVFEHQSYAGAFRANPTRIGRFGENTGYVLGSLAFAGWRIEKVSPQQWQKELSLGTKKGLTHGQWKNKAKALAQRLHPAVKITLDTSDAVCIFEWKLRNLET